MKHAPYLISLLLAGSLTVSGAMAEDSSPKESDAKKSVETEPKKPVEAPPSVEALKAAAKHANDTMSRALEDELLRSVSELKLDNRPKPYFVSYTASEQDAFGVYGSFGALDQVLDHHSRSLNTDVRVGDYKLDSSGRRMFSFSSLFGKSGTCSIDDDYDAIRHELWLNTDYEYKRAIEGLENKKAILQQKKVEDLPDSMARVEPAISMQPAMKLSVDKDAWQKTVRDVSGIFKNYPEVIDSTVTFLARAKNRWFANSEGSLNREGEHAVLMGISANGQSSDGMRVTAFEVFAGDEEKSLPTPAKLAETARKLATHVKELSKAKTMEDYRGPILFEKQAAAELFGQALAPRLVNRTESINSYSSRYNRAQEKPGRRILPTYISVVDDPIVKEYKGTPLTGGYLIDDEGVKAQKVTLVENGILKTYLSGRTPGRDVKVSNGHWIDGTPMPSQLFIESTHKESVGKLKEKLIQMGKDEGLEYVLIVRHINSPMASMVVPGRSTGFYFGSEEINLGQPTLLYKVHVKDGKEELVRGAKFARLTHRLFRDIQSTGDDDAMYPVRFGFGYTAGSKCIVTPSILISEIDIERESHESDTPMLLKNAFFEGGKTKTGSSESGKPSANSQDKKDGSTPKS